MSDTSTSVTLHVDGMSCASCMARVERTFEGVPGVFSAAVNLTEGTARLEVAEGSGAAISALRAASAAGYPARLIDADAAPHETGEEQVLFRRTLIALILTLPVLVLEMGSHAVPAIHMWVQNALGQSQSHLIQFVLTTLVLAWPGRGFFTSGVPSLLRRAPDMNALVAIGTSAAWGYSTVAVFLPGLLPVGSVAVYFEAAAVIVTLILLGRTLEARAKGKTGAAVRALLALRPDTARVERDGQIVEMAIGEIVRGDVLHIGPGERIPVDGTVTDGRSFVDESMLTGEPKPVAKDPGGPLVGGAVNGNGALVMQTTAVGEATVLAQIVEMVRAAQSTRLPVQSLVNQITAYFVPVVMVIAALTVTLWLMLAPNAGLGAAMAAGVAVLIVA